MKPSHAAVRAGAGRSLRPRQSGGWQDPKPHRLSQAAPSRCVGSWFPSRRKVPGLFCHPKIHLSSRLRVLFFKLVMSDSLTTASSESRPKLQFGKLQSLLDFCLCVREWSGLSSTGASEVARLAKLSRSHQFSGWEGEGLCF